MRATRGEALHASADRAREDLRRTGRHRHRERADFHGTGGEELGAGGIAGAADSDERDPTGHQQLTDRRPTGARRSRQALRATLRRPVLLRLPVRRRTHSYGGASQLSATGVEAVARVFPDPAPPPALYR